MILPSSNNIQFQIFENLTDIELAWLELQACADVTLTPYQSFEWIKTYLSSGFSHHDRLAIIGFYIDDALVGLLPLAIHTRMGVRVARLIGVSISNMDALILRESAVPLMTRQVLEDAFQRLKMQPIAADVVMFSSVAASYPQDNNPLLLLPHYKSDNNNYLTKLSKPPAEWARELFSGKRGSKLRRSIRVLFETFGEVIVKRADTVDDIRRVHQVFLKQREQRFVKQGISNIFASNAFKIFFEDLAVNGLNEANPTLAFDYLQAGDTILAISVSAYSAGIFTHYINSITDDERAKFSLILILMNGILTDANHQSIRVIEMGLGDFDYKSTLTEKTEVYDIGYSLTPRGALFASYNCGVTFAKRQIKQNPKIWSAYTALRAKLGAH